MSDCFQGRRVNRMTLSGTLPVPNKSAVILQAAGGERFDHQPSDGVVASAPTYFCRGCGSRLQAGFRGHFHKECLRVDKRRRVEAQRRREQKRLKAWLQRQNCPKCGARYDAVVPECVAEASCEASRPTQDGDCPGDR